ncbi:MAG: FapA family protein [Candidatus Margulisbacteria bacterium]|nr:FapA family protein [Candidatus Margulisiibacteriota bacterium]
MLDKETIDKIKIILSADDMEAILFIPSDIAEININYLYQVLYQSGIKYGVDEVLLKKCIDDKLFDQNIVIAKGKQPIQGREAKLEFFFETDSQNLKPKEVEGEKIDIHALSSVNCVTKDTLLLRKYPQVLSEPGRDVKGKKLIVYDAQDVHFKIGDNVRLSEDGLEVYSNVDGCPQWINETISVNTRYVVEADVDFSVGNIDFFGDVFINGNVLSGFQVKATGSIIIQGFVEAARIESGQNLNILRGIAGSQNAYVQAAHDIYVDFVDSATVEAGNSIFVNKSIRHSKLYAGHSIFCEKEEGQLIGGEIHACKVIQAKEAGTVYSTKTKFILGTDPVLINELSMIDKELETVKDEHEKCKSVLNMLFEKIENHKRKQDQSPENLKHFAEQYLKIAEVVKAFEQRNLELKGNKEILEKKIKASGHAKLSISNKIYPGVEIFFDKKRLFIDQELSLKTYRIVNDEIIEGIFEKTNP